MRAPKDLRDFADDDVAVVQLAIGGTFLVDANDDQVAVHGTLHRSAIDVDIELFVAAGDGPVAVGMHADAAGVVGREFEKRVTLAANGDDDAFALEGLDGALDFIARGVGKIEAIVNFLDAEKTIAALAEKIDDCLLQVGAVRNHRREVGVTSGKST